MATIDLISLGILWDRLISIADEIINSLVRSSFSTNVRESYDLSCVVFDSRGRAIAQGAYSVPSFTGTAPATLAAMLRRFPPGKLRPGDVVMTNDPWFGTGHLFDINVMQPVFRNGRIVGYSMSITHLPDIGGAGFSAAAREVYEEGLRLPLCPGLILYGIHPTPDMHHRPALRPAMKVLSYLALVKSIPAGGFVGYGCTFQSPHDMTVGIVPVGYGDGYDRRLSNRGCMIVQGHTVPVVGRVSMDQTTIDLTALAREGVALSAGLPVTVIDNDLASANSVEALAQLLQTTPHEIPSRLGPRVYRKAL